MTEIEVVGHRGWRLRYPDNTLLGLAAATRFSDRLEVDVRRAGDGKLVLAHDIEIDGKRVFETPWKDLGEVMLENGARPCLLDEALSSFPDTPILIEVKNQPGDPGFEPDHRLALEAAERSRAEDALISFNWRTVDAVRSHFPEVGTGLNVGVLGTIGSAIDHALEMGHAFVVPDVDLLKHWEGDLPKGISMFVWSTRLGESYEDLLDELASRGVSGIITDDPESTRQLLENHR